MIQYESEGARGTRAFCYFRTDTDSSDGLHECTGNHMAQASARVPRARIDMLQGACLGASECGCLIRMFINFKIIGLFCRIWSLL